MLSLLYHYHYHDRRAAFMTFMNEVENKVENKVEEEVDVEGAVETATSVLTQCLQERSGVRALPTCKHDIKINKF